MLSKYFKIIFKTHNITMESMEAKSHSVMESLRLGSPQDIYYYTQGTCTKQSIPTVVDNRFYQALNNLRQGSSTFIISVDQGLSDVILGAELPAQGGDVDYTGLALPRGWLYQLINRISVRYGSSSQYFWTGAQVLVENLREMPNPTTRDQLFQLGGAAMVGGVVGSPASAGDFAGDNLYAYAYLNLPHNSPNGSLSKPNPFPTELIGQPVVVTVEMNFLPGIFSSVAGGTGSLVGAPQALSDAYFQIKQIHAKDAGELMSMPGGKGHAYSFPTKAFYQNEIQVNLSGQTTYQPLLTGFRNGEVRSIIFWITKDSEVAGTVTPAGFAKNFTNYYLPKDIQLLYNGTVYFRAEGPASQMWNLISTETPSQLPATVLSATAGSVTVEPATANWVEIPFSQVFEQLSGSHMYVSGKMIQNAVVNLILTLPDTAAYTLHAVYSYNCNLMIADRGCEYFFG
jgi:hypothetical protein